VGDRLKRTYRYRLYPTPSQAAELERQIGLLCDVYNAALEQRRRMWCDHGVSIRYCEQSRQLTEARQEHEWLRSMNALAQHGALKRLDRAYEAFFRRCAAGEAPGYPRFRSRRRAASITWPQHGNGCRVKEVGERNGRVELQGVGAVKFRAHRPLPHDAKLGQMTVKCVNGRWWLTIAVELAACERSGGESDPGSARVVGLDVGVEELVALSTGERVRGPRIARARARALRRAQRRVSRRRRGSLSRLRAVRTLARAQEQVADARRDHAHKVSRSLADRHAAIAVEDLDVRSMTRSARGTVAEPGRNVRAKAGLNRAIADSAWGELRELLAYKLEERGGQLVAVPAQYTSQTCAECGHRAAENRPSRAVFRCERCGERAHADVNAARVIARRGEEKLYGSGETRVEDAAMAAPTKPNPPSQSDRARGVATPSEAGRDFHSPLAARSSPCARVATPSEAGRDFHPSTPYSPHVPPPLATSSGAGRDFHANAPVRESERELLATSSGAGRDFHFDACRRR